MPKINSTNFVFLLMNYNGSFTGRAAQWTATLAFWLHLFVTGLAWFAPFLFSWKILLLVYGAVMLQFAIFGRCLLNEQHGLIESDVVMVGATLAVARFRGHGCPWSW